MNIYETLQTVKQVETLLGKQNEIQTRIGKIKNENTKLKLILFRIAHWTLSALFWILVVAAFLGIINYCKDVGREYNVFEFFCMCLFVSSIPVLLYILFKDMFDRYERKRAYTEKEQVVYDEYIAQYNQTETKLDMLLDKLKTSEIPRKYWYSYALEWMIDALECKRANTLTDLINLYEQFSDAERRHNEQLETLCRTRPDVKVNVRVY